MHNLQNIKWGKVAMSAVVLTVVAQIVHMVEAMLTMDFYKDPAFFGVWSKVMMPTAGPPPASFMYTSLIIGLISWALFVFVYQIIKAGVPGDAGIKKGVHFGILVYLVGGLPGILAMYLLINLPQGMLVAWAISGLILSLINGALCGVLNK